VLHIVLAFLIGEHEWSSGDIGLGMLSCGCATTLTLQGERGTPATPVRVVTSGISAILLAGQQQHVYHGGLRVGGRVGFQRRLLVELGRILGLAVGDRGESPSVCSLE